jgi:iron complex transport system permease protein
VSRDRALGRERLHVAWVALGILAVLVAAALGLLVGPAGLPAATVAKVLLDHVPGVHVSGLTARDSAIVWNLRLPRVMLGLLVGAALSLCGGAYQGAFRNPLADPYLLGVAAGAGLGATLALTGGLGSGIGSAVPIVAFVGAMAAVVLTYAMGAAGGRLRSPASLILAGVAVANFLTANQTFIQQRHSDTIREVYSWILGRLSGARWTDVGLLLPYVLVASAVLLSQRRTLDVLAVGDDEARSLGLDPGRSRLLVVVAASLGTAAAVSVSGLIGFVGIIVPHTIRLIFGATYRVILPLSLLFGAAFLCLADLFARTALAPAELPIGVVTAFVGAPFFVLVLRTSGRVTA